MNLFASCKSCRNDIKVNSKVSTRPDLQMEKGDEFTLNCQVCGKTDKVHVNDVNATSNNITIIIGIVISVIFTAFLWMYFGGISTLTLIIPILFWQQQTKNVRAFNIYRVRRK